MCVCVWSPDGKWPKLKDCPSGSVPRPLWGPFYAAFQRTLASHFSLTQRFYQYGRTNLGTCALSFLARACVLLPGARITADTS